MWRIVAGVGLVLWGALRLVGADSPLMPWLVIALGLVVLAGERRDTRDHRG